MGTVIFWLDEKEVIDEKYLAASVNFQSHFLTKWVYISFVINDFSQGVPQFTNKLVSAAD